MAPIRVGLIGLGRHGIRYAQHLRDGVAGAELVAVCRRNVAQGEAFAGQHGLRFYSDYRNLIADREVDAILVVTSPSLTSSICLEAVRAKKPLLIEKPLACTGSAARTMVDAAESAGVPLMTAQTLRFDSAIQAFKEEIAHAIPAQYVALTYRLERNLGGSASVAGDPPRGILLEIGTHLFDLIRYLTGHEIGEVRCEVDELEGERGESRALVSLRTTGNLSCLLDLSRLSVGRVSRVEWIARDVHMTADWTQHRLSRIGSQHTTEEWTVPPCHTVAVTMQAFVTALERGTPMPITGRDGYRAVQIADACYESARTNRTVRLVEP